MRRGDSRATEGPAGAGPARCRAAAAGPPRRGGRAAERPERPGRTGRALPRLLPALLLVLCGLPALPLALEAQSRVETVVAEVGDRTLELAAVRHHGFPVVNLSELLGGFLSDVSVDMDAGVVRARAGGEPLLLRSGSPFVRLGGRAYQLANPPYVEGGVFWVPTELVTRWWPRVQASPTPLLAMAGEPGPTTNRRPGPWRVVIDPGHGGRDPGTRGRAGTREKDVVLDISLRVHRLLRERAGFEPILTRDSDVFVELAERSRFAVKKEGDLFLSIHANSAPSRTARGFETYYLGEARSEEARRVAMRENAALQFERNGEVGAKEIQDLEFILAGLDRSQWVRQSSRLGGFIQNSMRGSQPGPDRGVKPGPYWVLVGASGSMPAVLVEVGFLSHADEERVLAAAAGRQRIAASIADAVEAYFEDYGRQVGIGPETVSR